MGEVKLLLGDCLDKLKELEDNSVDSVVTDPPYEIGFMGKGWDDSGIANNLELWKEVLRVLKPGGHLLSFSHSRTYHRQAVAVEDAGFEIRDQIMWVYGSGFPKSHNIGKAVDKIEGNEREVVGDNPNHRERNNNLKEMLSLNNPTITKGNSEWEGWGTALKPAHEPIVMARKPLSEKTVADNVLEWGTGGINIDGCRISHNEPIRVKKAQEGGNKVYGQSGRYEDTTELKPEGRFPANIIFDEEAGKLLDEQTGVLTSGFMKAGTTRKMSESNVNTYGHYDSDTSYRDTYGDSGGASRFFYCPKTSKSDRSEGNNHPTVKPTDLMAYLIRLVTPKGGIVLDPFMGSGSTGKAAVREGMDFIGIERETEYFQIAEARINWEINKPTSKSSKTKKVEVEKKVEEKVNQFFG